MLLQDTDSPIQIELPENRGYSLFFRPLDTLPVLLREHSLRPGRCILVTDKNVADHYIQRLDSLFQQDGWEPLVLVLPAGEATKSDEHLYAIYDAALAWGIDRQTPVVAIGGGVIGDLSGYAASTLLRGIPVVHVPTSLIAQVDSAIGGKTGINRPQGKNLVGTFYQPRLVCIDTETLFTLPRREWHSGLAEVFKHALIRDETFFSWLEDEAERIVARDPGIVRDLVYRAASIKADVVERDETEQGIRTILNFGHTFGHALERVAGYGHFTHGEAVAVGMRAALYLSRRYHRKVEHVRAERLIRRLPVPSIPESISRQALLTAMQTDKKADAGILRFVLLKEIGNAYLSARVTDTDLDAAWAFALSNRA
jgi:3-dehydroquinate synthase